MATRYEDWLWQAIRDLPRPDRFAVGIDLFPYTQEELRDMLSAGNPFLKRALDEGVTLFERP